MTRATFAGWKYEAPPGAGRDRQLVMPRPRGPFCIEVFQTDRLTWRGRLLPTGQELRGRSWERESSAQNTIAAQFEEQLTPWTECGEDYKP